MTNNLKEVQSFVREKCGGDSLAHVLNYLREGFDYFQLNSGHALYDGLAEISVALSDTFEPAYQDFFWQLLKDNREAKLHDQSEETILAIAKLLGFEGKEGGGE